MAFGLTVAGFGLVYTNQGGIPAIGIGLAIAFVASLAWIKEPVAEEDAH